MNERQDSRRSIDDEQLTRSRPPETAGLEADYDASRGTSGAPIPFTRPAPDSAEPSVTSGPSAEAEPSVPSEPSAEAEVTGSEAEQVTAWESQAAEVAAEISERVDTAFEHSMADSPSDAGEYETSYALKQGLFGERMLAESLNAEGYQVLTHKPDISGTNQPGFDLIAVKDGEVFVFDNKAYATGRNVGSASAITDNRDANLQTAAQELREIAADPELPPDIKETYNSAADSLETGDCRFVVAGAAFAADGRSTPGITDSLAANQVEFYNVITGQITTGQTQVPAPPAAADGSGPGLTPGPR